MRCKNMLTVLLLTSVLAMGSGCNGLSSVSEGGDAEASSESESKAAYALYADKVSEYSAEYGDGEIRDGRPVGLYYVQLVDFDADGLNELVLGYKDGDSLGGSEDTFECWCYSEGSLKRFFNNSYDDCSGFLYDVGYLGKYVQVSMISDGNLWTETDDGEPDASLEKYIESSHPAPFFVRDFKYSHSFLRGNNLEEGYSYHLVILDYHTDDVESDYELELTPSGDSWWTASFDDEYEFQDRVGETYSWDDAKPIIEEQYGAAQWRPLDQDMYDIAQETNGKRIGGADYNEVIERLGSTMIDESAQTIVELE